MRRLRDAWLVLIGRAQVRAEPTTTVVTIINNRSAGSSADLLRDIGYTLQAARWH